MRCPCCRRSWGALGRDIYVDGALKFVLITVVLNPSAPMLVPALMLARGMLVDCCRQQSTAVRALAVLPTRDLALQVLAFCCNDTFALM